MSAIFRPAQLVFVVALIGLSSRTATSQQSCNTGFLGTTCVTTASVSMTAGVVVDLTQSSATTSLGTPVASDFTTGFKAANGPTLDVKSNGAWTIQIRAATSTWAATNTSPGVNARTNKPAADLTWSGSIGGTFVPLTLTGVTLLTGNATATTVQGVFYRTLYSWLLDTPGDYSLGVILTLSSP